MRQDRDASISPTARSILQIAYDPALLKVRQIMLEKSGYRVTSALGNDNGIALVQNGQFDVVVIGFSTRLSAREHMVRWIKQHAPDVQVVVLLAHEYEKFPDADYSTLSEDPEKWLAAVADCIKRG